MRSMAFFAVALLAFGVKAGSARQGARASAVSSVPATVQAPASSPIPVLTPLQRSELQAAIQMARKEYKEAIRTYREILETRRNDPEILNRMGIAYQQLLDFRHAERCYKQALRGKRNFGSALNNLGTVEYDRRHYSKAVKLYNRAITADPHIATVYSNLGYAYFDWEKYPQAMDAFGRALAIDPALFSHRGEGGEIVQQRSVTDPGKFHYFIAKSYALLGDAEQAAHFLKLSRDEGYKQYAGALRDPGFARVIKDPRVLQVIQRPPAYLADSRRSGAS